MHGRDGPSGGMLGLILSDVPGIVPLNVGQFYFNFSTGNANSNPPSGKKKKKEKELTILWVE